MGMLFSLWQASIIAVYAQPMHLTAAAHLILADDGNVVLALAGQHARGTADTGIEVNGHSPLMHSVLLRLVEWIRVERLGARRRLQLHDLREVRVLVILLEICLPHRWSPFH